MTDIAIEFETYRFKSSLEAISKNLPKFFKDSPGLYLAGGALRSVLNNEKINDFDFFFSSKGVRDQFLKFLISEKAETTFKCPEDKLICTKLNEQKNQLISTEYYEDQESVIRFFDFNVAMFCLEGTTLLTYSSSMEDLINKELTLNTLTYPSATIKRIAKYISYGYFVKKEFYNDIVNRISNHHPDIKDTELIYID
jgi:hypothetical protein